MALDSPPGRSLRAEQVKGVRQETSDISRIRMTSVVFSVVVLCLYTLTAGQGVVFPTDTQEGKVADQRWKRLRNTWTMARNRTGASLREEVMDNEVEWERKGDMCGNGELYCLQPLHYPEAAIAKALRKNKRKAVIAELFDAPEPQLRFRSGELEILEEFENVCPSQRRTIAPRVGTNAHNQQRYLVQGGSDLAEFNGLVRTIETVQCLGSQAEGERESCAVTTGRRTECRQQHTEHRMVALDMERGELVVEAFSFPSCCSCMVHRGLGL